MIIHCISCHKIYNWKYDMRFQLVQQNLANDREINEMRYWPIRGRFNQWECDCYQNCQALVPSSILLASKPNPKQAQKSESNWDWCYTKIPQATTHHKLQGLSIAVSQTQSTGSSIITGVKIMAHCSKIKSPCDFLRLLGAYQMWSINKGTN